VHYYAWHYQVFARNFDILAKLFSQCALRLSHFFPAQREIALRHPALGPELKVEHQRPIVSQGQ
jgi:hypothetical protein